MQRFNSQWLLAASLLFATSLLMGCLEEQPKGLYRHLDEIESGTINAEELHEYHRIYPAVNFALSDTKVEIDTESFTPLMIISYHWTLDGKYIPPMTILHSNFIVKVKGTDIRIAGQVRDEIIGKQSSASFELELPQFDLSADQVEVIIDPSTWQPAYPAIKSNANLGKPQSEG